MLPPYPIASMLSDVSRMILLVTVKEKSDGYTTGS